MVIDGDIATSLHPMLVLARRSFSSGIGSHAACLVRTLGNTVPLTVLDIDDPKSWTVVSMAGARFSSVLLAESPFGRPDLVSALASIGGRVPRACVFAWDSDTLDPYEAASLGAAIDVVLSDDPYHERWHDQASSHLEWYTFPLSIDLRALAPLALTRGKRYPRRAKVLSMGAYHPRKQHEFAIEVVGELVHEGHDLELMIHSNLDQGEFAGISRYAQQVLGARAIVTNDDKNAQEISRLFAQADIFLSASRGESYNAPLRMALASGLPSIAYDVSGHRELSGNPNVTLVPARIPVPAVHPERQGRVIGRQWTGTRIDLKDALNLRLSEISASLPQARREGALDALKYDHRNRRADMWRTLCVAGLVESSWRSENWPSRALWNARPAAEKAGSRRPTGRKRTIVVPAHDAGFLALHNVFASHARWWATPEVEVIPDWSARAVRRFRGPDFSSFCYAAEDEGNAYFHLFDSPFEGVDATTNLEHLPGAVYLADSYNAKLDPYLTYVHPDRLYQSVAFAQWRKEMNRVASKYLTPRQDILAQVDSLIPAQAECPYLGVHVRHPSHAMEQRDGRLPSTTDYIDVASAWLDRYPAGKVFLATDQDVVVDEFLGAFGSSLVTTEVMRVTREESLAYQALPDEEKLLEGFQVQHIAARDAQRRSSSMAREVLMDTWLLGRCSAVLHSVSNVATAVSFINPNAKMLYMRGGMNYRSLENLHHLAEVLSPV